MTGREQWCRKVPSSKHNRSGADLGSRPRQPGGKADRWQACEHQSPWASKASSSLGGHLDVLGVLTPLPGPLLVLLAQLPHRLPLFWAQSQAGWGLHVVDAE